MNFDQLLAFEAEVATPDQYGGSSVAWVERFRARGEIFQIKGQEAIRAQQLDQVTTHRIRIRHHRSQALDVHMRIVWVTNGDKVLNIIGCPDPGPRAMFREIIAQEGGAV